MLHELRRSSAALREELRVRAEAAPRGWVRFQPLRAKLLARAFSALCSSGGEASALSRSRSVQHGHFQEHGICRGALRAGGPEDSPGLWLSDFTPRCLGLLVLFCKAKTSRPCTSTRRRTCCCWHTPNLLLESKGPGLGPELALLSYLKNSDISTHITPGPWNRHIPRSPSPSQGRK